MSTFVFPTVTANGWSSPSPPTGMGTLFAVTTDCNAAVQFDASSRIWPVSSLTAVKVAPAPAINDPSLRLVIRLWPTSYQVEAAGDLPVSLWIGIVTLERLEHPGGIATLAMTDQDFGMPTAQLAQSLQTLGVRLNIKRAGTTAVLLVRWPLGADAESFSYRFRFLNRTSYRGLYLTVFAVARLKPIWEPILMWHCDQARAWLVHLAFRFIHFSNSEKYTMTHTNEASALHKKAASDHEAAATHHHKAADCHDQNKMSDAKTSSKSAMDCCNTAQKHTKAACDCSAK